MLHCTVENFFFVARYRDATRNFCWNRARIAELTTCSHHAPLCDSGAQCIRPLGKFQYRLKQIDHDGNFVYGPTVEVSVTLTPDDYALSQNFPNPFNPSTKIQFALATTQFAEVKVFNSLGEKVKTLFSGVGEAGVVNEVQFDGKEFAPGVYFYSLTANGRHEIKKMVLLK